MLIYLAWAGDLTTKKQRDAALANDAETLRRISQAVEHGGLVWRSWVESKGGSVITYGGGEGRAQIDASHLEDIPRVRHEFESAIGGTATVGIGQKLAEADRALLAGRLKGGDQVVLYTPEVQHEIDAAAKLGKAEGLPSTEMSSPAMAEGQGNAGLTGAHAPAGPKAPTKPRVEGSEHSQGEAAAAFAEANHASPEQTHAAQDLEEQFHDAAGEGGEEPESEDPHVMKQRVAQVLLEIKSQAKVIAKLKEVAPDAYKAVTDLVTEMIQIARQIPGAGGGAPVKKAEPAFTEAGFLHKPSGMIYGTGRFHDIFKLPTEYDDSYEDGFITHDGKFLTRQQASDLLKRPEGGGLQSEDLKDMGLGRREGEESHGRAPDDPRLGKNEAGQHMVYRVQNGAGDGPYKTGAIKQEDDNPNQPPAHTDFDPEVFQAMDERGYKFGFENPQQAINWFGAKNFRALQAKGFKLVQVPAKQVFHSKSKTQCIYEPAEALGKMLPMPHANPHHHTKWPLGATDDKTQRVKIQHKDGAAPAQQGWVQVQDGQVLSRDGHPISARNPGGR